MTDTTDGFPFKDAVLGIRYAATKVITGFHFRKHINYDSAGNEVIGTKDDAKAAQTDTTSVSAMSVWKQISASVQAAATSVALQVFGPGNATAAQRVTLASNDPAVTALATLGGTTADAKVITDATGTVHQYLRGLVTQWIAGTLVVGAGQNVIGKVDGDTVLIPADATFTLPSNTQYGVGELVANSGTANLVVAAAFTITKTSGQITSAGLKKSSVSVTSAVFRAHIYAADPTLSTGVVNGDNAAFSTKVGSYLGAIDLNVDQAFSDAAFGRGTPRVGNIIEFSGVSGLKLYALYEARATYTPTNGETITPSLGVVY